MPKMPTTARDHQGNKAALATVLGIICGHFVSQVLDLVQFVFSTWSLLNLGCGLFSSNECSLIGSKRHLRDGKPSHAVPQHHTFAEAKPGRQGSVLVQSVFSHPGFHD